VDPAESAAPWSVEVGAVDPGAEAGENGASVGRLRASLAPLRPWLQARWSAGAAGG